MYRIPILYIIYLSYIYRLSIPPLGKRIVTDEKFAEKAQCLVDQHNKFSVLDIKGNKIQVNVIVLLFILIFYVSYA